ncbi:MAG: HD domain-containing protein [Bacteroidota bacterium]|nr:HD domain-containing protein [Bacteroidota bacterium]
MRIGDAGDFIINKLNDELPGHLIYHNSSHAIDVYEAAKRLSEAEGITGDDLTLLLTAAHYHDAGFLVKAAGHEEESCRIARNTLPNFGYNNDQIDRICGMIMATHLPQSPKNHLEEILADADLDNLGRDDFFDVSHKLFLEGSYFGEVAGEREWDLQQIDFIEHHQYFTKTAINLRQAKKDANLGRIKALVNL